MGDTSKAREKLLDPDSRPHFFKILLFPTDLQHLPIPRKFVRKFKRELSDVALLKGPSGIVWSVGIKEAEDGIVYFSNGWNEVTEHYSLSIGHFLVFRYDGNSQFNVMVFDETACEKEYPYPSGNDSEHSCSKKRPCALEKEEEIDSSVEILGVSNVKDGGSIPISRVLRSSARLHHYNQSNALEIKSRGRHTSGHLGHSVNRCSKSEKAVGNQNFQQAAKPHDQTLRRSKRTKCIQSNSKELFVPNVYRERTSSISTPMDSENGTEFCAPSVKLVSQETELSSNSSTSEPSEDEEVIKYENAMCANGRVSQRFASGRRSATSYKEIALQEARKFNSNYPFFVAVKRPAWVHCMIVPLGFIRDHLPSRPQRITLQVSDGRHWPAGLVYRKMRVLLSEGWLQFRLENNIVDGDVCVFELLQTKKVRFKVTIYRAHD